MLEKKRKEPNTYLSKAGKFSDIQASLKLSRYKISSVQKPKKKNFTLDLDDLNNLNDDLVIMKVYETSLDEEMQKINKIDKGHKKKDKLTPKTKLKFNFYRNIHQNNTDSSNYDGGPSRLIYRPKYDLIFPKVVTGPEWKYISGRKYKKIVPDEKDFIITHDSIIDNEKKSSVNMNKNTQRGTIFGVKDVRIRTVKKFDYKLNFKLRKKLAKLIKQKQNNSPNQKQSKSENKTIINKNDLKSSISISEIFKDDNNQPKKEKKIENKTSQDISLHKSNNKLSQQKTFYMRNNENSKNMSKLTEQDISKQNNINIRTIDFNKTLSREKREKALSKKKFFDLLHFPNYAPIFERPKMLAYYTVPHYSSNRKKIRQFKGINSYLNHDPNTFHKIRIVHPLDKVPNFNLMLPRPDEDEILPSFMQKMFNREELYNINDKALKLNEYSKQKLGNTISTFFPKKSYNNIINMNLMTGKMFEDDYKIDDVTMKKEEIKNRIKFRNKNIGKIIKEGGMKKFDNVTYKTIYKTKNIMSGDLNKYLLGLKEK